MSISQPLQTHAGIQFPKLLALLRVHQWVKNTFLLIPAFMGGVIFQLDVAISVGIGFLSFCLIASAVYILNDIVDVDKDRLHPDKRQRPLASGDVSIPTAYITMFALLLAGGGLSLWLPVSFTNLLIAYFQLNVLYSFWLKEIAIVDVCIISTGFVIRVLAGGVLAGVLVTNWLMVMTFQLALLMAIGKRRSEYQSLSGNSQTRRVLEGYNLPFLNMALAIVCAITIVSYMTYTVSDEVLARIGNPNLCLTSFFVVIGVLRYLQQVMVFNRAESPTKLLYTDGLLQVVLAGWGLTLGAIIYGPKLGLF